MKTDKTITFNLSDDNSPDIIAMEVRHISGKRLLTGEDKETLSKAADIIEQLYPFKKMFDAAYNAAIASVEEQYWVGDQDVKIFKGE